MRACSTPLRARRSQAEIRVRCDRAGNVRLVVEAGPADRNRRRVLERLIIDGIAVEAGDGAESASHGSASAAALLEVAAEALDISAPRLEETEIVLRAPGGELAQVECVRLARETAVASKIATESDPLGIAEHGV